MKNNIEIIMLNTNVAYLGIITECVKKWVNDDKVNKLLFVENDIFVERYNDRDQMDEYFKCKHLYMISKNEEEVIKKNDWIYTIDYPRPIVMGDDLVPPNSFKIIATTDINLIKIGIKAMTEGEQIKFVRKYNRKKEIISL